MKTEAIVAIFTALGTLLASPGILRGLRVLGETRKARIAAHVEEAKAPIQRELDMLRAERGALDESWASVGRQRAYFDDRFDRLLTDNASLRERVAALEAEVKRLSRIEERCEVLEQENRELRGRVREMEGAAVTGGAAA